MALLFRRHFQALALLAALVLPYPAAAQTEQVPLLVVSRADVLNKTRAAELLAQAEREMTASLQARVDRVKEELDAEEAELTRLRATLPREEFEERVRTFDLRVRTERRAAQREAAVLQQAFRDARRELVEALGPILERIRRERGALAIVDASDVLARDPSIDVTEQAIQIFDSSVAVPEVRLPEPGALDADPEDGAEADGNGGAAQ